MNFAFSVNNEAFQSKLINNGPGNKVLDTYIFLQLVEQVLLNSNEVKCNNVDFRVSRFACHWFQNMNL